MREVSHRTYTHDVDSAIETLLTTARDNHGLILALTGAGISAESGIPTFRGEEGYWTVGSQVYRPQDMATNRAFSRMPDDVWSWYLHRRNVCRGADPNPAHDAIVALEGHFGDRFRLITQNVDGLHLRAGNTLERTYQIHGNIDYMRCANDCSTELWPVPDDTEPAALMCKRCDCRARPHVLWFDETYDEPLFRFESSLRAAGEAALLIVIGTSASTTLPWHVVQLAAGNGTAVIDVNIADNPFGEIAEGLDNGAVVRASAAETLPAIAAALMG